MKLEWAQQARDDLQSIGDYIGKDSPVSARKYVQKLIRRTKGVSRFPYSGRIVPEFGDPALRELIVDRYRIVYEIRSRAKKITLLTIFESHKLLAALNITR